VFLPCRYLPHAEGHFPTPSGKVEFKTSLTNNMVLPLFRQGSNEFQPGITHLQKHELMGYRKAVQVVFQDPYSSLSPRMRVGDILAEPLEIHTSLSRAGIRSRVGEVLELVGLAPDAIRLFQHAFSGGQRQRIAIARALVTEAES
jgi:peptide/nickel transport system ATP-binding protein